ncbi:endonuclease/exonuclease/phosphatase family protein [uncultured Novosphingobium sp.]|uniref:endonuclease/exonuclease/phosphatase family protein n=1 Tax=uncultured Novosphingobium sp. TaxID=292277 RepID=UPI002582D5CB|nr:endonuclease/exonuclease/phosphatase family protein [uncultured Novosphingobium sp.]
MRYSGVFACLSLVLSIAVTGCGTAPPLRRMAAEAASAPTVRIAPDGVTRTATLSVLTYNVEGLGWPARSGREQDLVRIGAHLAALRAAGKAPDVVLFQEVFSGAAKRAVLASGYPAIVPGPRRTTPHIRMFTDKLPHRAKLRKGEIGVRLTGSGLVIASRYLVLLTRSQAYGRRSCAGLDCLANKGVMLARIAVPGVPVPIDLYDTHMNSRRASHVAEARNLAAHARQVTEASAFIDASHDDRYPIVFGGDFNMRGSQDRWENFTRYQPMRLVHRACMEPGSDCKVHMSWDGDEPWVDTQDLQFFGNGERVTIRPVRVEALFDGGPNGPVLSDHDGFLVEYELTWRQASAPVARPPIENCQAICVSRKAFRHPD